MSQDGEAEPEAAEEESRLDPGKLIQEVHSGPYVFRSYYNEEEYTPTFVILRDGVEVFAPDDGEDNGGRYQVVSPGAASDSDPEGNTEVRDITGDGIPDLIVQHYSGGAHCCYSYRIIALGPEPHVIAALEGADSDFVFSTPDLNGLSLVESRDDAFAYWKTAYAFSPSPSVVLEFSQGEYHLAAKHMKKPPPSEAELFDKMNEIHRQFAAPADDGDVMRSAEGVPVDLWADLLELIYTGNGDLAWRFFERAWPAGRDGKAEFLQEFREQLAASQYWPDVQKLNGWQ